MNILYSTLVTRRYCFYEEKVILIKWVLLLPFTTSRTLFFFSVSEFYKTDEYAENGLRGMEKSKLEPGHIVIN